MGPGHLEPKKGGVKGRKGEGKPNLDQQSSLLCRETMRQSNNPEEVVFQEMFKSEKTIMQQWVMTPLGVTYQIVCYQIFTLLFITEAKSQLGSSSKRSLS